MYIHGVDAGCGTNNSNLLRNLEAKCKPPPGKLYWTSGSRTHISDYLT
jgi:hypothetical protein